MYIIYNYWLLYIIIGYLSTQYLRISEWFRVQMVVSMYLYMGSIQEYPNYKLVTLQ